MADFSDRLANVKAMHGEMKGKKTIAVIISVFFYACSLIYDLFGLAVLWILIDVVRGEWGEREALIVIDVKKTLETGFLSYYKSEQG